MVAQASIVSVSADECHVVLSLALPSHVVSYYGAPATLLVLALLAGTISPRDGCSWLLVCTVGCPDKLLRRARGFGSELDRKPQCHGHMVQQDGDAVSFRGSVREPRWLFKKPSSLCDERLLATQFSALQRHRGRCSTQP